MGKGRLALWEGEGTELSSLQDFPVYLRLVEFKSQLLEALAYSEVWLNFHQHGNPNYRHVNQRVAAYVRNAGC
jgi:hypothetical protein